MSVLHRLELARVLGAELGEESRKGGLIPPLGHPDDARRRTGVGGDGDVAVAGCQLCSSMSIFRSPSSWSP